MEGGAAVEATALNTIADDLGVFKNLTQRQIDNLTKAELGDLGEQVAKQILDKYGYKNFLAVQNASNHGIDIVCEMGNGQWAVFEVKATNGGRLRLSPRQADMKEFLTDVLKEASNRIEYYQNISPETAATAKKLLNDFNSKESNIVGNVIGVDFKAGVSSGKTGIMVKPWK